MSLILITGASTGLGLATAETLAGSGHDVVAHVRNRRSSLPSAKVRDVVYGDLTDLDETVAVAEQAERVGRFDAVIHNAGVYRGRDVFAVNTVAPYVLSALMTAPARAVYLSSGLHKSGSADLERAVFGPSVSYDDSKLYVTALAMAYAERHPHALVHVVDPGWVPTRMGGPGAPDSLEEGHRTQEWLATAPESEIEPRTGGYWFHQATRPPHPAAHDRAFQDALLRKLGEYTGIAFP
jgi:NAD(P)-dependent dehydrogenase (short-subunit alcohol dehydrogenase family)